MKVNAILLGLLASPLLAIAQNPAPAPTLTGIVNLPELKCVFVENNSASKRAFVLREGQRIQDLEVIQINPETGIVKLRAGRDAEATNLNLKITSPQGSASAASVILDGANLELVLQLYSEIAGRTLLRWPTIPTTTISVRITTTDRVSVAQALEKALAEKELMAIPDGEKFIMLVPKATAASVTPRSAQIKSNDSNNNANGDLPAGAINFSGASLPQFVSIYAEFAGGKFDRSQELPSVLFSFQNRTSLNRQEALYAMETLLAWNGFKLASSTNNLMRAVPVSQK